MGFLARYHLWNYPPGILLRKIFTRGNAYLKKPFRRKKALKQDPRQKNPVIAIAPGRTKLPSLPLNGWDRGTGEFLWQAYKAHRFDLLGTGWIPWSYDAKALGMEGWKYDQALRIDRFDGEGQWLKQVVRREHWEASAHLWQMIDDPDYRPIDWQRDMKSGFRWDARQWGQDQGRLARGWKGADPKLPIELSRLQHLPRMALLSHFLQKAHHGVREFRSQVLDFMAANPPGMGINWHYSMDVGIRLTNLLVAFDLFRSIDEEGILDRDFQRVFAEAVVQHADFISRNLEYQDGLPGNHYLFNITGLLFAGTFLESTPLSDSWVRKGVEGMIKELFRQFFSDGGNFEGSTAYHRLGLEMMLWCSAWVMGEQDRLKAMGWNKEVRLPSRSLGTSQRVLRSTAGDPLPKAFRERLFKAVALAETLTAPNGEFPQIGDNDSGCLFRLTPVGAMITSEQWKERYGVKGGRGMKASVLFDENLLEQGTLLSLASALFQDDRLQEWQKQFPLEGNLAGQMSGAIDRFQRDEEPIPTQVGTPSFDRSGLSVEKSVTLEVPDLIPDHGEWGLFPGTGWYVFRTDRVHLTVSGSTGIGIRHTRGHVHNDKLSFTLFTEGKEQLVDPGSYVYGALPEERNRFRSGKVHNIPWVEGEEQDRWTEDPGGLFFLAPESRCTLLETGPAHLELGLTFRHVRQTRKFILKEGALRIEDRSNVPFEQCFNRGECYSRGYGKKMMGKPGV